MYNIIGLVQGKTAESYDVLLSPYVVTSKTSLPEFWRANVRTDSLKLPVKKPFSVFWCILCGVLHTSTKGVGGRDGGVWRGYIQRAMYHLLWLFHMESFVSMLTWFWRKKLKVKYSSFWSKECFEKIFASTKMDLLANEVQ